MFTQLCSLMPPLDDMCPISFIFCSSIINITTRINGHMSLLEFYHMWDNSIHLVFGLVLFSLSKSEGLFIGLFPYLFIFFDGFLYNCYSFCLSMYYRLLLIWLDMILYSCCYEGLVLSSSLSVTFLFN